MRVSTRTAGPMAWCGGAALLLVSIVAMPAGAIPPDGPPPRKETNTPKPTPTPNVVSEADGFDWYAPQRMQDWANAWKSLERQAGKPWPLETYDPNYVNPSSWTIYVNGCGSEAESKKDQAGLPTANTYRWEANGTIISEQRCRRGLQFPAQGIYPVTLTVTGANGKVLVNKTRAVTVRDILFVVLGDSMSSGEGTPDQNLNLATGEPAQWVDRRCHRSKAAGGAQAALWLEQMDPKTSVTFLSFACSGATIERQWQAGFNMLDAYEEDGAGPTAGSGMLGGYIGIEAPPGQDVEEWAETGNLLPPQVDALRDAIFGKRVADVIVMSGGLNDAAFSKMLSTCVLYPYCPTQSVGYEMQGIPLPQRFKDDVDTIPGAFAHLGDRLHGMSKRVITLEYPNPFTDEKGKTCDSILEDVPPWPFAYMSKEESDWAQSYAAPLFLGAIREGADRAGFEYLAGVWEAFRGHGYCSKDAWLRRAQDSKDIQGPLGPFGTANTKGTIHPTFAGYATLASFILDALLSPKENLPPVGVPDAYTVLFGHTLTVSSASGLLANDYDPNIFANLKVDTHTPTNKGGQLKVNSDGSFEYRSPPAFSGTDWFFYTLTDGVLGGAAKVTITVQPPVRALPPTVLQERPTATATRAISPTPTRTPPGRPPLPTPSATPTAAAAGTGKATPPATDTPSAAPTQTPTATGTLIQ